MEIDEFDEALEPEIDEEAFAEYVQKNEELITRMEKCYSSGKSFNRKAIPKLREPALTFEATQSYTKALRGTPEYKEHWVKELRRMRDGHTVEDVSITGYNYFYLNYCPILKVVLDENADEDVFDDDEEEAEYQDEDSGERISGFPDFWKTDYDFFWLAQIAEKGIAKKKYDTLKLDVELHPSAWKSLTSRRTGKKVFACKGGKGLAVTKCRGSGFSYKLASMGMRNVQIHPESRSFYYVGDKRFLDKDGILAKAWGYWRFHNTKTGKALEKKRQKTNQMLHKVASVVVEGEEVGYMSQILGMVVDNPAKIRGGRSKLVVFEEAGSFPKLLKSWQVARALVNQGGYWSGLRIAFGTGGDENAHAILGLETLFYRPTEYELLPIKNMWDKTKYGKPCGFFVPVFTCMQKFLDKDGFPLIREAIIEELRERFKFGDDKTGRDNHIAEGPFTPVESFLRVTNSEFPLQELLNQQTKIESSVAIQKLLKKVELYRSEGKVKWKKSEKIEIPFPHKPQDKRDVPVVILEEPEEGRGGVPDNKYYIVHDPYMKDKAPDSLSLGATYVMKRSSTNKADIPIAWYVGRPDIRDDYNNVLFMLADLYNAKIQSEYQGGGQDVVTYAKIEKRVNRLMKSMDILNNKEGQSKGDAYFMNLSTDSKATGITYLSSWLKTIIGVNEHGHEIRVYDRIYDINLLEELIRYSEDGNFDRISAMIIACYVMKQNDVLDLQETEQESNDRWNNDFFKKKHFASTKNKQVSFHDINTFFG